MLLGLAGNVVYALVHAGRGDLEFGVIEKPEFFLLGAALVLLPMAINAIRIILWTKVFGKPLRFRQAVTAVALNDLGASVTPTAVGGGYLKLVYLYKRGLTPAQATLVMLIGSIEDVVFLALMIALILFNPSLSAGEGALTAIAAAGDKLLLLAIIIPLLAAVALVIWRKRSGRDSAPLGHARRLTVRERVAAFLVDLRSGSRFVLAHGRGTFVASSALACVGWGLRYVSITALLLAFDIGADPLAATFLNWCAFTVSSFVATPGGMGGAEASFSVLFASIVPESVLPLLTLSWRFLTFYLLVIVAVGLLLVRSSNLAELFVSTPHVQPDPPADLRLKPEYRRAE